MRIIQLSDIHLSSANLTELQNYYLEALITDLKKINCEKQINIILLTGDLLDKGGKTFLPENGYEILEKEFIKPILEALNLSKENIFFIPGNHDINESEIDKENEFYLANKLTKEEANNLIKETRDSFTRANNRIKNFKEFEKFFHSGTLNYKFSNNESLYISLCDEEKVGFALINDSWWKIR